MAHVVHTPAVQSLAYKTCPCLMQCPPTRTHNTLFGRDLNPPCLSCLSCASCPVRSLS